LLRARHVTAIERHCTSDTTAWQLLLEDLTVRCSVLTIGGKPSMLACLLSVLELSALRRCWGVSGHRSSRPIYECTA
jgi:hypothetical protein